MKLKSVLLGLLFSFVLIPSFSSAEEIINNTVYVEDIPDTFVIGNYTYSVDKNLNFITNSTGNFIELKYSPTYNQFHHFFGWIDKKLYYVSYDHQQVQGFLMGRQGFINSFCTTNNLSSICGNFNITAEDFYSMKKNITKIALGSFYNYVGGQIPVGLCFYNSLNELYYCAYGSWNSGQYITSSLTGSLGFSSESEIRNYNWGSSYYYAPDTFYFSTGSCPSVGQLKASSNLTPAVCYGGYGSTVMYGDQVAFVGGSGMSIFDVYNDYLTTFSDHSMNIQTFYDTYWAYYQNISHDSRPFEGLKKSYLGIQFARQTFGNTRGVNGSYMILNYCYYVVNNIPDNTSTCVGSNISSQYSGVVMTDQDKQDIVDAVNDSYVVHHPGTGSIFDDPNAGLGGGGSSWGDDECSGIPCLFDRFYQMFTSSRINDVNFSEGGQGILPQYIALAFVVVVLFYVFKR